MTSQSVAQPLDDADLFARPGDVDYDAAIATFNLTAGFSPAGARVVRSVDDVVTAVGTARAAGFNLRTHATGHGAGSGGPMQNDSVLIRTALSGPVHVDPVRRVARVPAGTRWQVVADEAAKHGLIPLHGSSPTVGVIGYLLRGGLSFYGRSKGLAANSVRSLTVVLADGSVVRTSAEVMPDLFWAIRGGGGGFGVVVEAEIELFPMAKIMTGAIIWDASHARTLAPLWCRWTETAPPEITTSLRLMNLPPLPGIPPELSGRQILVLDGAVTAERETDLPAAHTIVSELLAPLRATAAPIMDTWREASPVELLLTHMDPLDPLPYAGDHLLLHELGSAGIDAFIEASGPGTGTNLVVAELRQLGGAFAEPTHPGGALDRLDARFLSLGLGVTLDETSRVQVARDLDRLRAAMEPWSTGFTAPTFVEDWTQPQRTLTDDSIRLVDAVRIDVDPLGLFAGDVAPVQDASLVPRL